MRKIWTTLAVVLALATLSGAAQAQSKMDDAWQSVLRRWVGNGWKPFHEAGFNFTTPPNTSKRWGAGLKAGAPVVFAAICGGGCRGVELVLRDRAGKILASTPPQPQATSLQYTPRQATDGSIELRADGCRAPACPIRYTSFVKR